MALTIPSRWLALGGVVAVLAVYLYGRSVQRGADREQAAQQVATTALTIKKAWQGRYDAAQALTDTLQGVTARLRRQIGLATMKADSLSRVADSARVALHDARTPHDSLAACLVVMATCEQRVAAVQAIATSEHARAGIADSLRGVWQATAGAARGVQDSLAAAIKSLEAVSECRILFLRCPSRGAMLFGGAVLGAVGVTAVRR